MHKVSNTTNTKWYQGWMRAYGTVLSAAILAVLFVSSGVVSYQRIRIEHDQDTEVNQLRLALVAIGNLYTDLNGTQADAFNFVISGQPSELQLYLESRNELNSELVHLPALAKISPTQELRVRKLERLIPSGMLGVNSVVVLRENGHTSSAIRLIGSGVGVSTVNSSRIIIDQMIDSENSLLVRAAAKAAAVLRETTFIILVVFAGDLLLLAIIALLVRQSVRLREELAEEVAHARSRTEIEVLRETTRRMDEFIGIASHEFRTPLAVLKASLQLVTRRLRRRPAALVRANASGCEMESDLLPLVERATLAADRLERLACDLLDVSRIRAGELIIRPSPFELGTTVSDCVFDVREAIPNRTITLHLPEGPTPVLADPDRIRQAIANYLTNALKFSADDKPVHVALRRDEHLATVTVQDFGPGLPPDEQVRIWERFHRSPEITHQSGSNIGLGLGLYITRTIIEHHGGQVGVESRVGEGATFWFTLPITTPSTGMPQGAVTP